MVLKTLEVLINNNIYDIDCGVTLEGQKNKKANFQKGKDNLRAGKADKMLDVLVPDERLKI